MSRIVIKINPKDNTTSFDIEGMSGTSCTDLTELLTRGDEVSETKLKAEFYDGQTLPQWEGIDNSSNE